MSKRISYWFAALTYVTQPVQPEYIAPYSNSSRICTSADVLLSTLTSFSKSAGKLCHSTVQRMDSWAIYLKLHFLANKNAELAGRSHKTA